SNARAQAFKARPACCTFRRRLLCVNDAVVNRPPMWPHCISPMVRKPIAEASLQTCFQFEGVAKLVSDLNLRIL
ncbi:MAG: hypothetical protein IJ775_04960, partial [Muribaculaceae bacterium]|nr:hypothetical protein [Muribaculaceae bacterium]